MKKNYDVVIIGGGMVGLTLACALGDRITGNNRLHIAVIEANEPDAFDSDDEYDLRVSAISRASQQVFENLNVWQSIQSRRISAFEHMHVWDGTGEGEIHFDAAELGVDALGHIVENRVTQIALMQQVKQQGNVDLLCPVNVERIEYNESGSRIVLDDGHEILARLLVGADGAHSRVRDAAGIGLDQAEYNQKALVCVVKSAIHHQHTAWQRFLPTGPLAFLPLSDGRCSIVWSTSGEQAEALLELGDSVFCHRLEQAFDYKLGAIESVGQRAAFPLVRRHAEAYVKPGLALVGDAAHTIHPLAGQGVNLGVLDAVSLAQVMINTDSQGMDIASRSSLRKYERWRRGENTIMMFSMSGFKNLFSNEQSELSVIRNAGLNLVNSIRPLKNRFMRHAMGLEGDLPDLAKSVGW
jgi:2-polyprenylphenol 6-hydroxylase